MLMSGGLICIAVCLSVQTRGVVLASWCVPVTTYWLLFGLWATAGMLATLCVQRGVVGLPSQQKKQTLPDKKSVCSV